jgi:hypothetical protein
MSRTDRRMTTKASDATKMQYACKRCGAVFCVIPTGFARKKPDAAKSMLDGAMARHRATTGCDGKAPPEAA